MSKRMAYRKRALPSIEEMLEEALWLYGYDDANGGLIWRNIKHPNVGRGRIGTRAGGNDGHGYLMCLLLGHKFKVHQIVWMIHHKAFPDHPIDHVDGDRLNNRIENLRKATDHQNLMNMLKMRSPTCGVSRSTKPTKGKPFEAKIQYLGKKYHLGTFATVEEANAAYRAARRKLSGDFSPV